MLGKRTEHMPGSDMNSVHWYNFHRHMPADGGVSDDTVLSFSLCDPTEIPTNVYFTIALHPWDSARPDAEQLIEEKLPTLLTHPRCLALGECGLDRLRGATLPVQVELLAQQLSMAKDAQKPLVVHCVRAWSELLTQVQRCGFAGKKAVHGFNGSLALLKQLLAHDWYISVGLDSRGTLPRAACGIPLDRILLETDASNTPIKDVYKALAKLHGLPLETTQKVVQRNAKAFFGCNDG